MSLYQNLRSYDDLVELLNSSDFIEVDKNFYLIVSDIVRSTGAIQNGKYKEVNAVNAAIISAVLNLDKNNYKTIPFSFGGDGVCLVIPPGLKEQAVEQLTQAKLVAKSFDLEIRCALIPVKEILEAGQTIKVGKFKISDKFTQAIFFGGGVELGEKLAKSSNKYEVLSEEVMKQAVLHSQGFTCRWEPIPPQRGITLSLIIKSRVSEAFYGYIYLEILRILGDRASLNPLTTQGLNLTLNPKLLNVESTIRFGGGLKKWIDEAWIWLVNLSGKLSFIPYFRQNVQERKEATVKHSDYIKIDGSLKMTVDVDKHQFRMIESYLESLYKEGKIFYGLHMNQASLVTCLVFPSEEFEVHFVDGSDGGYALASVGLKKQLQNYALSS